MLISLSVHTLQRNDGSGGDGSEEEHHFAEKDSNVIGDLISDAMQDSTLTDPVGVKQGVPQLHRMEVKVTGESLLMEFDSDSDNEASGKSGDHSLTFSTSSPLSAIAKNPPSSSAGRRLELESMFSDSDDDFCIVHTPTSTKVVSKSEIS